MKLLLTNLDGYNKLEDYINHMASTETKLKLFRSFENKDVHYKLNLMFIHEIGKFEAFIIPKNLYIH